MPVIFGEIIGWEILVPLALIAIFFGGAKIPKLARSLGQAQNEFKKGLREGAHDDTEDDDSSSSKPASS
ncbi:MAG: twin-arginine translocase TatA/TatE family subunit [Acidimicrobiia bacterium]